MDGEQGGGVGGGAKGSGGGGSSFCESRRGLYSPSRAAACP